MIKISPLSQNINIDNSKRFNKIQNSELSSDVDSKTLENDLSKLSEIAKSQINFRGGSFKLNKLDLLFASSIATTFSLSAAISDKVKTTIANFLNANNYSSMSELRGEENIEKQCELTEEINNVVNLDEDDYIVLVNKVFERCDSGDNYNPDDNEYDELFKRIETSIKKYVEVSKQNDEKFINAVILTFDLNPKKQQVFRDIIAESMKKYDLQTLGQIGDAESFEMAGEMLEKIVEKLGLTVSQEALITAELVRRTMCMESNYKPKINPLDRNINQSISDSAAISKILQGYDLSLNDIDDLIIALKQDAYEYGFSRIFDIFDSNIDIKYFAETNEVLNSERFEDNKIDILIDIYSVAKKKDDKNAVNNTKETKEINKPNSFVKNCAIICMLDDKFDFTKDDLNKLKAYFKSAKLDVTNEKDFWQAVYEISEKFNVSGEQVEKAIREANEISEEDLDIYNFELANRIIDKK